MTSYTIVFDSNALPHDECGVLIGDIPEICKLHFCIGEKTRDSSLLCECYFVYDKSAFLKIVAQKEKSAHLSIYREIGLAIKK
jgi:hypothetical protein